MTTRALQRIPIRALRRNRQWAQRIVNGSIVVATQAGMLAIDLLSELESDLGMVLANVTISALNYEVDYRLTDSTTGEDVTVIMGIILIGKEAFGIGGVSLPDPAGDHADWMFWDGRTMSASRDVSSVDEQVSNSHLIIRNRSMRKMRENHQTLAMIFRSTLLQPTSLQIFIAGRALVLLP